MATWVTHLMIADGVLDKVSGLDKRGFCVGNIAPDCNVENGDWTDYTPSREVTHWMSGERKTASDCDRFYKEYIENRLCGIKTDEEYSFLMGYYSHLIADAEFQRFVRDENRVASAWKRIKGHSVLMEKSSGMPQNWDSVKILIDNNDRMKDIYSIEADYLEQHPESGYFTEILKLATFPDYIDYLPKGAIVRKINVMGYIPKKEISTYPYIAMSKEEYKYFVDKAIKLIIEALEIKSFGTFRKP
ncbi:MAG: zinc dependent phospholipase C family protein [Lachnospiraceae bacterium]|nr:zinc dependent phospholipase C family protein [Lachnospiraceae bacterium]